MTQLQACKPTAIANEQVQIAVFYQGYQIDIEIQPFSFNNKDFYFTIHVGDFYFWECSNYSSSLGECFQEAFKACNSITSFYGFAPDWIQPIEYPFDLLPTDYF